MEAETQSCRDRWRKAGMYGHRGRDRKGTESTPEQKHLEGGGRESQKQGKTERKDTSHNEGPGMETGIVQRQKVKEREQEIA